MVERPEGFCIALDGVPLRMPSGGVVCAPRRTLAEHIAREWAAQGDRIKTETLPLTALLNSWTVHTPPVRQAIADRLVSWLDTDLLCYRAPSDSPLATLQQAQWDPWLEGFAARFGTALATTHGLVALSQPPDAVHAVRQTLETLDGGLFTALQAAVASTGSVVLGLALVEGSASPQQACAAVFVEEAYHARLAGEDKHGPAPDAATRRAAVLRDLEAAALFAACLRDE